MFSYIVTALYYNACTMGTRKYNHMDTDKIVSTVTHLDTIASANPALEAWLRDTRYTKSHSLPPLKPM